MGADLLLTWTTYPITTDGKRLGMAELPALCAERIATWQQRDTKGLANDREVVEFWREDLERYVDEQGIDGEDYYLDPVDSTAPLSVDEITLVRRLLTEDVLALAEAGRGELASVTIGGTTYLFTGGPSWGDSPTDVFDSLERIDRAGLFEAPFPRGTEAE
jgi:hypothetical protein